MIVRLIVVDPRPQEGRSDLLIYQVPENSREYIVLVDALSAAGLEWVQLVAPRKPKEKP